MSKRKTRYFFPLIVLCASQLFACGGDDPEGICDSIASNVEDAGDDWNDDAQKDCEEAVTKIKDIVDEDKWSEFAECAKKTQKRSGMTECVNKVQGEKSASKSK